METFPFCCFPFFLRIVRTWSSIRAMPAETPSLASASSFPAAFSITSAISSCKRFSAQALRTFSISSSNTSLANFCVGFLPFSQAVPAAVTLAVISASSIPSRVASAISRLISRRANAFTILVSSIFPLAASSARICNRSM